MFQNWSRLFKVIPLHTMIDRYWGSDGLILYKVDGNRLLPFQSIKLNTSAVMKVVLVLSFSCIDKRVLSLFTSKTTGVIVFLKMRLIIRNRK